MRYFEVYSINLGVDFDWTLAFERPQESSFEQNNLLGTLPDLSQSYQITFDVNLNAGSHNPSTQNFRSILFLTSTGNNCCSPGDRIPAIFYRPSDGAVSIGQTRHDGTENAYNTQYGGYTTYNPLPEQEWHTFKVQQILNSDGTAALIAYIGGYGYYAGIVDVPQAFTNVNIYAGNPWMEPANGSIRNLEIRIGGKYDQNERWFITLITF